MLVPMKFAMNQATVRIERRTYVGEAAARAHARHGDLIILVDITP